MKDRPILEIVGMVATTLGVCGWIARQLVDPGPSQVRFGTSIKYGGFSARNPGKSADIAGC